MSVDSNVGTQIYPIIPPEVFLEEEEDAFIYQIREEIIQNAMKEIHEIYLRSQLYNLVAECACEACSMLISFEFYHHNPLPDLTRGWLHYQNPKTSTPDSWACGNLESSTEPVAFEPVESEEALETTEVACTCDPAMSCSCQKRDKELKRYVDALNLDYSATSSTHSVEATLVQDTPSQQTQGVISEEYEVEQAESTTSGSVDLGIDKVLKAVESKSVLFPKLVLAPQNPVQQKVSRVDPLPPIRVEMDFDDEKQKNSSSTQKKFIRKQ